MKFDRNVGGGTLIGHVRFYVFATAVGLIFSAVAATAATTISTDIFTGGTLTVTGLSTFGNASSTLLSATNGLWVGSSGATTIFGSATSTFGAGVSATYLNLSGTSASSTAANGINLTAGCFAVNGTCVGSSGSGTVNAGTTGQIPYYASNSNTLTATSSLSINTAGQVLGLAGTAAAPAYSFTGHTDTGIYGTANSEGVNNGIGISNSGKKLATFSYRLLDGVSDNVWLLLGTGQSITNTVNDTYVSTIATPSVLQSGASNYIGLNIGSSVLTATDTVTKTGQQAVLEMDKLDLYQTGGSVTYNNVVNTRFRFAIPHTGVTIVDSRGIDFVVPNPPDGSVTNYKAINFPALTGGGGTNFYGLFFNNNPNGGSIASGDDVDISIISGSVGTATADIILNASTTGSVVKVLTANREIMRFGTVGATLNYLRVDANNTPLLYAQGPGDNVALAISSKGTSGVSIFTSSQGLEQFRVTNTASAVNYWTATGGAAGTGVTLSAAGSDTNINLLLAPKGAGGVGIGVTAPTVSLQVATSSSNATTSVEIGKTGQNKGSCLVMYDAVGTVQYVTIQGGAFVISPTSCK